MKNLNATQEKTPRKFVTSCCKKCGKPKNKIDFYAEKRNRDGLRSLCKNCYLTSIDKEKRAQTMRVWYEKNKDRLNGYQRKWRKANKEKWSVQQSLRCRIRNYIKTFGGTKNNATSKIIGCSYTELTAHLEKQFLKGMDWHNYGEWHIDHIVPLSKAINVDEAYKLCHFTNLRPLWAKENLQKFNKAIYLI